MRRSCCCCHACNQHPIDQMLVISGKLFPKHWWWWSQHLFFPWLLAACWSMLINSMMICCLLSLSFTAAVPHRLDKSPCFPCQSCRTMALEWYIHHSQCSHPFGFLLWEHDKELMLWTSLQCLASAEKNRSWSCSFPMVLILCVTCYPQLGNPKSKHELQRIQAKSHSVWNLAHAIPATVAG